MKGGTTAAATFLSQHPQLYIPKSKELHFFDVDERYLADDQGLRYDLYHRIFRDMEPGQLGGEATPIYMYLPYVPGRIAQYNPDIKLILLLRNPIQRAYSHYRMECALNREPLPFLEALQAERGRVLFEKDPLTRAVNERWYSYVGRGLYSLQLMNIFTHFPKERVLVLRSEDLLNRHDWTIEQICRFLGVDVFVPPFEKVFEGSGQAPPLTEEAYHYLQKKFAADITRLETLLNWDLSNWKASPAVD